MKKNLDSFSNLLNLTVCDESLNQQVLEVHLLELSFQNIEFHQIYTYR